MSHGFILLRLKGISAVIPYIITGLLIIFYFADYCAV